MSPMERDTLNPCEKLRRYGKIPWKLSIHVALVLATTLMVHIWSSNDGIHIRHSFSHFHRTMLGVSGSLPADRLVEIPTAEDLRSQIDTAVGGYWNVGDSRLSNYSLCKDPLIVERVSQLDDGTEILEQVPLQRESWKSDPDYNRLITTVSPTVRSYSVRGVVHDRFEGSYFRQCLRWSLDVRFDYGGTGLIIGYLDHTVAECSKDGSTNTLVPIIVIILAIASAALCSKAEWSRRSRSMIEYTNGRLSGWYLVNLVANILQITAAFSCMRLTSRIDVEMRFTLIGLAAVTAWICVLRYLRYFHMYYVLVRTLSRAVPKCARFVTGVFPILAGYALLGTCLFHQSAMFSSIGASLATLFSLLNGDIIRDTFSDICQLRPVLGEIYLYSFLCLFIYVVLHLFISIVEEAYFSTKHQESPSEAALVEMTLTTTDSASSSSSAEVTNYVLANIKRDLDMLKGLGGLNKATRAELSQIINH
jgi:hypothetical protein